MARRFQPLGAPRASIPPPPRLPAEAPLPANLAGGAYARLLLDSIADPVLLLDPRERRILAANRAFLDQNGHAEEAEVVGRLCHQAAGPGGRPCPPDHPCPFDQALNLGEAVAVEQVRGRRKSRIRHLEVIASPIRDGAGQIVQMVHVTRDQTPRRLWEEATHRLALRDPLTELPNRALLQDRLDHALAQAERAGGMLAVLFLDLYEFKRVNDTLGHAAGDLLLQSLAQRLSANVRKSDTVARVGGDEFIVLVAARCEPDVENAVRNIIDGITRPYLFEEREVAIGVNVGIALYPNDAAAGGPLLHFADMAMYEAKRRGRNTYQFFSGRLNQQRIDRQTLEIQLREALDREEFFLVYQPQLDVGSGRVVGLEAFLRWRHPLLGPLAPGRFLPLAEETGLILPIGEWVLRTACRQCRSWQLRGLGAERVAVNLSLLQFRHPQFADRVDEILRDTGLGPDCLDLELREEMLMGRDAETGLLLSGLRGRGINLVIDDFGTGYSSLNLLGEIPIDRLKVAQDFVRRLPHDPRAAAVVEAVLAVARSLGKEVLAEGVESRGQVDFLLERDCRVMQGYYFAPPCDGETVPRRFAGRSFQPAAPA